MRIFVWLVVAQCFSFAGWALPVEVREAIPFSSLSSGATITKHERSWVVDVRLGQVGVRRLFVEIDPGVKVLGYYLGLNEEVSIKVKDAKALAELRSIAINEEDPFLELVWIDKKKSIPRRVNDALEPLPLLSPWESAGTIRIPLELDDLSPCEQVTRLVYTSIDDILKLKFSRSGQTETRVNLDQVFSLLLNEKVEPFIRTLDPVDPRRSCFKDFALYKWLKKENVEGFEFARYKLQPGLMRLLVAVVDSLARMRLKRYLFEISVTGYADPDIVLSPISLSNSETGIDGWDNVSQTIKVYYDGCFKDMMEQASSVLLGFDSATGELVGARIDNNCELGAVRAYVAAGFLRSKLGDIGVKYKYGTGGVLLGKDDSVALSNEERKKRNALKRKVEVAIVARAADKLAPQEIP